MTPETFEHEVRQLCGTRLLRVRYYELFGGYPAWDAVAEVDTVDHGLDLICDTGTFHITLDNAFWSYGMRVQRGALVDHLRAALFTDVTEDSRWTPLIGQQIKDVMVHWEDVPQPESGDGGRYPQDIVLSFGAGTRVFLSAATYQDASRDLFGMSDNVVVIFDETVAQRLGVGLSGSPQKPR